MTSLRTIIRLLIITNLCSFAWWVPHARADQLRDQVGRNTTRVWGTAFRLAPGRSVWEYRLEERLTRLGYQRVGKRPDSPGQYFWGHEHFWIFRHHHQLDGSSHPPALIHLQLRKRDGLIRNSTLVETGSPAETSGSEATPWLEPELVFESVKESRAPRIPLTFEQLPEHLWQAVLAAEDSRFFEHSGIDGRSVARALLANLRKGKVAQGGSTITQQLIKVRDLSPQRTLTRKASEAVRALALEADYDKEEILEAYLDQIYLGHHDGLGIYGFGAAAHFFFSRSLDQLDLQQAALLAAIIQSPNRLSPERNPDAAKRRRDWVLGRLAELGWQTRNAVASAKRQPLGLRLTPPRPRPGRDFRKWLAAEVEARAPRWSQEGRGVVIETGFDPLIQAHVEEVAATGIRQLRGRDRRLAKAPIQIAISVIDAHSGNVVAHLGSDPSAADAFDRARRAKRQPGSTLKPLLLLEAFEHCGRRAVLSPASRVADEPLTIDLPSGPWSPRNFDDRYRGVVTIRSALRESLNVPFVRIARWCGWRKTAARLSDTGLPIERDAPPSFALGALELTPLELAGAYTTLAGHGQATKIRPLSRLTRPGGRSLARSRISKHRVTSPESAFLIRDLLRTATREGTSRASSIEGETMIAKTGTTNDLRDAWLAGYANQLVAVVWIGLDDGQPLGLSGSNAAAPIWREVMEFAARQRPREIVTRPSGIREVFIDPESGLVVRSSHPNAQSELYRDVAIPKRSRFWRSRSSVPVIR